MSCIAVTVEADYEVIDETDVRLMFYAQMRRLVLTEINNGDARCANR